MNQNSVGLCGTTQQTSPTPTPHFPHEHLVLGPEPSNQITALTLQGAQFRKSLCHQQWPNGLQLSLPPSSTFLAPQGPTPCGAVKLPADRDLTHPIKCLRRPPLARNCSLYFVKYFIVTILFFLSLVGTVTRPLPWR